MASDDGLVEGSGDGQAPMGGEIRRAASDAREMIDEFRSIGEKVDKLIEMFSRIVSKVENEGIEIHIVRVSDKKVLDVIGEGGQIGDIFPFGGSVQFGKSKPPETQG